MAHLEVAINISGIQRLSIEDEQFAHAADQLSQTVTDWGLTPEQLIELLD